LLSYDKARLVEDIIVNIAHPQGSESQFMLKRKHCTNCCAGWQNVHMYICIAVLSLGN